MHSLTCFTTLAFVAAASAFENLPHIIGGKEATIGAWPWQGSLQYSGFHSCGCVIVSDQWVVTAAHCVQRPFMQLYEVVLGLHDLVDDTKGKPQTYEVDTIIPHEGYGLLPGFAFDLAVIRLSKKIYFVKGFVEMISIANTTDNFDGANCTITGWGGTRIGADSRSPSLQEADVNVLTNDKCKSILGEERIDDSTICVFEEGFSGACNGDDGGPLVCPASNTTSGYTLAGVSSSVIPGCDPVYPSVYTRISYYNDWIRDKIGA